jgi:HlyD family secretion protein
MRKFITIFIILAVILGGGYYYFRYNAQKKAAELTGNLQTETATRGSLTATIGATGQVRSQQTADLVWKTSGTVENFYFKVGDQVKAGDKLAELSQTSLPQTVILAQADYESGKKALDDIYTNAETARLQALQSISTYAKAVKDAQYQMDNFTVPDEQARLSPIEAYDLMKKKLDTARAAFEPYKFYPSGDKTRDDLKDKLDNAQADFNVAVKRIDYDYALQIATANLDKARSDYDRWKNGPQPGDVTAAQARINAAQATINQAWIEAPFGGILTLVEPQIGDQVTPNTPAFRIDDLETILVDVLVSEIDINQVEVSQPVTMTFDAIRGRAYTGIVTSVDKVGLSNQGVIDFTVTLKLLDPDEQVKPGMTAAVNIAVVQLDDVLLVPNRAVRYKGSDQVVYILKSNQIVPITIQLGATSDAYSQVTSGDLKPGDTIVLNPPTTFDQQGHPPFMGGGSQ